MKIELDILKTKTFEETYRKKKMKVIRRHWVKCKILKNKTEYFFFFFL